MPVIHKLSVYEDDDKKQTVMAVREDQACGSIEGGGTCPQPLRIVLREPWASAPELLAACEAALPRLIELRRFYVWKMGTAYTEDFQDTECALRAVIEKAKGGA